jgi:hypothetical protein
MDLLANLIEIVVKVLITHLLLIITKKIPYFCVPKKQVEGGGGKIAIKANPILVNSAFSLTTFPNPTDNETTIRYNLVKEDIVDLYIINSLGVVVKNIELNSKKEVGVHQITIEKKDLPHGTYFCIFKSKNEFKTIRLIFNSN